MTSFFIGCFAFGLLFTVATFLLGGVGGADSHGTAPGLIGGLTGSHGSHASTHATGHGANHVSPFSLSTLSAFLTWFGGAGYLLTRYSPLAALGVAVAALIFGVIGAGIFFTAIARYIVPRLTVLNPDDFRTQGAIARVTSTIAPNGIGEIVYTLGGTRHADGARSESGAQIDRGTQRRSAFSTWSDLVRTVRDTAAMALAALFIVAPQSVGLTRGCRWRLRENGERATRAPHSRFATSLGE